MTYSMSINGRSATTAREGLTSLLEVLRDDFRLLGAKPGCLEGRCGACTVLVDGEPVVACLTPVANCDGREVRTVEGLAPEDGPLSRLQDELLAHGGVQCGACIPGVLMALTAHLEGESRPTEHSVREALAGNICRCTGYQHIVAAALAAAGTNGASS
jgi:aerobic-type carbon monoxide dehydrogenase small subunit (CoxS/CutS family)